MTVSSEEVLSEVRTRFTRLSPDAQAAFVAGLPPDEYAALAAAVPETRAARPDHPTPADLAVALDERWQSRPHLRVIAQTIADRAEYGGKLIVNVPPQTGKSQVASVWTPAWYLDRWPDRNIVLASYADTLAVSKGRQVRRILEANAASLSVELARDPASAAEWETTEGGGMLSAGIGGSITGRAARLLIIDDPIKDWVQAHSRAWRDTVWNWWLSVARSRLHPDSLTLLIQTRWHEDDLAGRLLSDEWEGDPADWDTIVIPALSEGDGDPLGRPEGGPLIRPTSVNDATRAAAEWEATRRDVGPYIWAGMYQQHPSAPEGAILKRDWWRYWATGDYPQLLALPNVAALPASFDRQVSSWDMAFKDTSASDWVVGQVWAEAGADRLLLDESRSRADFVDTKRAVKALASRWPDARPVLVEDKANGPAIISELRSQVRGLVPRDPKDSKEARVWAVTGDVEAGNVLLPHPAMDGYNWVREWVNEAADFPNGAHDDRVDAFTQAMLFWDERVPASVASAAGMQLPRPRLTRVGRIR